MDEEIYIPLEWLDDTGEQAFPTDEKHNII